MQDTSNKSSSSRDHRTAYNISSHELVSICAIISLTCIAVIMILAGIDSTTLFFTIATIAGISGYSVSKVAGRSGSGQTDKAPGPDNADKNANK